MTQTSSLFMLLAVLCLSGCSSPRAILWNDAKATASSIAAQKAAINQPAPPKAVVPVYVATSRKRQDDLAQPFGSKRAKELSFVRVDVGIPQAHKKGSVEANGNKPDPAKHFAATAMQNYQNQNEFLRQINKALETKPKGKREIFLFIHGYNNNFADSTFRAAQFAYDFKLNSVSVHYAWPSGGSLPLYVYDRDSADYGSDGLAELLTLLANSNADTITVVAHSMGNYVIMEALRTLALTGHRKPIDRISSLLLASPDIDVDVFERQLKDIKKMPRLTAVLVSSNDKALSISGTITGGHSRIGDGSSIALLQSNGITVIDMSNVDGGSHGVFASSPTLMALVQDGSLSRNVLAGEGQKPGDSVLADSGSVVRGATSLILYTPGRILSSIAQ